MCGQVHTSTGCKLVLDGGQQMTNEKDRVEAKAWLDRSVYGPENTTERLADRFAAYRSESVKAERERCIIKIRSLAYEGKGMTNYGANKYNEALGDAEDAILSDDQEARNG